MSTLNAFQTPTVSVLLTVYEPDPVFFPKAVRSILNQSWQDFELIIVEDPSPRAGKQMLEELQDPRIRYISNPQRVGLVAQKNQGLELARGRLIALMDADDVAQPRRLAKQVEFLDAHPEVTVLGSQIDVIDTHDRVIGYRQFPLEHEAILRAFPRIIPVSHPSVALRRDLVESFGGYQVSEYPAAADYEFLSRLIQNGARFVNYPEALLSYRIHPAQMKSSKLRETILGDLRVKELYWADRMNLWARLRFWAQKQLLHLPEPFVLWLAITILYRDRRGKMKADEAPGA